MGHKSGNISETRKDTCRWKVTMDRGPIGTHQRSFERYRPDSLRLPLPKIGGSQPQLKTAIGIISGRGKAKNYKFGRYIHRSIRTKAHEKFGRKGSVAYPGIAQIFGVPPTVSGTGKATNFKFGRYIHRVHPNKSPWKFGRKWSVGVTKDCPIFWVPPIISGMGKATNFKFCTHIHWIDRNKSPLKISAKIAVDVLRDSGKFSGHPYIGRISRSSLW